MSDRGLPPRPWNVRWNLPLAAVAVMVFFALSLAHNVVWLPGVFASLLSAGLPGSGSAAQGTYAVTFLVGALPGVTLLLLVLLWWRRRGTALGILVIVGASLWFVTTSPGAAVGRVGTRGVGIHSVTEILASAGADPAIADAWAAPVYWGFFVGSLLGIAAGLTALSLRFAVPLATLLRRTS